MRPSLPNKIRTLDLDAADGKVHLVLLLSEETSVADARQNLIQIVSTMTATRPRSDLFEPMLFRTGQDDDHRMYGAFIAELGLPEPAINLGKDSGSHAEQTGKTLSHACQDATASFA